MILEPLLRCWAHRAMVGWLGLVLGPRWRVARGGLSPVIAPVISGAVYVWLMTSNYPAAPEGAGFGSLAGVTLLFSVPELLLAGWIHYLAFDLFVGAWEVKDAQQTGIHHLAVIPCLFATLMFGPGGLLLYLAIKFAFQTFQKRQPSEA